MNKEVGSKISVCLLVYNHAHLIESTLASVQKQTLSNYEIIVSDDCSTDDTWTVLKKISENDPRIRCIQTPSNLGMPGNANFAVSQSSRPYIALLHHDDIYRDDLLEKWGDVMERNATVSYVFNPYDTLNAQVHYGPRFNEEILDGPWFLENHLFARWGCPVRGTAMIRRSSWNQIGGMRTMFGLLADVDMWMRLAALGPVGYVNEPLIAIRQDRPDVYPREYKSDSWSWSRRRYLYEIHALNRLNYYNLHSLIGRLKWLKFRIRLSIETSKWLTYAVIRKKHHIIKDAGNSETLYDMFPLIVYRKFIIFFLDVKMKFGNC